MLQHLYWETLVVVLTPWQRTGHRSVEQTPLQWDSSQQYWRTLLQGSCCYAILLWAGNRLQWFPQSQLQESYSKITVHVRTCICITGEMCVQVYMYMQLMCLCNSQSLCVNEYELKRQVQLCMDSATCTWLECGCAANSRVVSSMVTVSVSCTNKGWGVVVVTVRLNVKVSSPSWDIVSTTTVNSKFLAALKISTFSCDRTVMSDKTAWVELHTRNATALALYMCIQYTSVQWWLVIGQTLSLCTNAV